MYFIIIKQILKNIYIVLIILNILSNVKIVGEPDLTIVANKHDYNSGFTFRCIGANTSVTSAIYWTDKDNNVLVGRNAILPKPDYEESFEEYVHYLWEVGEWSVQNSKYVETITNIQLTMRQASNIKENVFRENLYYFTKPNHFLFSNSLSEHYDIVGPQIPRKQKSFCLSLFYTVCSKCSLKIAIQIDSTDVLITEELLPSNTSDKKWIYKKIFRPDISVGEFVQIYFRKNKQGETLEERQFWAIDNIRTCTESEILINDISTDNPELKCNILEENDFKIDGNLKFTNTNDNKLCEPGYIGLNCTIKCDLFGISSCEKTKICNKRGCNCSPGFKPPNCLKKCEKSWGINCKQRCAQGCKEKKCNHITGNCACSEGFTGENCRGKFPVLKNSPIVVNLSYSFIYVKQDNLQYTGNLNPKFIHFQYKRVTFIKTTLGKNGWIDLKECQVEYSKSLKLPIFCNVTKLSISTSYTLKVLLYTEDNKTQVNAPLLNFSTKCKVITDSLIKIEPLLKTATLKIVNLDDYYCDLKDYEMVLSNGKTLNPKRIVEIQNLLPSTEYTVTIRSDKHQFEKKINFITQCDIPQIEDIRSNNISKSLKIEWKLRTSKECITDYYVVLRELKPHYCLTFKNTTIYEKNISNEYVYIPNVKPFYDYQVTISGQNVSKLKETRKYHLEFTTKAEDIHTTNISPEAVKFDSDKDLINITLPSCKEVFGPLKFNMKFDCLSDWCKSFTHTITTEEISEQYDILTKSFKVINVRPYTEYNLTVQTQMLNHTSEFIKTLEIRTKPGVPPLVTNPVIYSRSNHSLWLRWKPPYPQYGELEKFIVFGSEDNKLFKKLTVTREMGCNLWLDEKYICKEIKHLKYNTTYHIRIAAKNKNVKKINNTSLFGTTIQAASSPPLNITIIRQFDSKINLSWYHPDITNGPLKSFEITIIEADSVTKKKFALDVQYPKKQYYYNISVEPAKTYNVTVFPKNNFLGEPAWIIFDTDPPAPDLKDDPYIICKENKCSIVVPEPKNFYNDRTVYLTYMMENNNTILVPEFIIELDKKLLQKLNPNLLSDANYLEEIKRNLIVVIKNHYKNKTATRFFKLSKQELKLENVTKSYSKYLIFLWILLGFPVGIVLFFLWKRFKVKRVTENEDTYDNIHPHVSETDSDVYNSLTTHYHTSQTTETTPLLLNRTESRTEVVHKIELEHFLQYMKENLNIENYQTIDENSLTNRLQNQFKEIYEILQAEETDYKNIPEDLTNNYLCIKENDAKTYFALEYKSGKVANFWTMVWNIKITTLVFTVENFSINELYTDKIVIDGHEILITVKETNYFHNFSEEIILLTSKNEKLQVCVVDFKTDNFLPETLTPLLHYLNNKNVQDGPVLFADSMGMALAGILIFCDMAINKFKNESICSFQNILKIFRKKSKYLINEERYIFIHVTVLEYLLCDKFSLPVDINFGKSIRKTLTTDTVRPLMDLLDITLYDGINYKNVLKYKYNRSSRNVQELIGEPNEPSSNKYSIDSILEIDRQNSLKKFVIVEQPASNFFKDFWGLIIKKEIKLIVCLNDMDFLSDDVFFPLKESNFKFSNNIEVHSKGTCEYNDYNTVNVLTTSPNKNINEVRILLQRNWKKKRSTPENIVPLLEIIKEVAAENESQVLVTCFDGVKASGIFIALYNIIEKMNADNKFDVYRTVRDIKRKNINFVNGWDQLEFLYKASLEYTKLKQEDNCS